MIRITGTCLSDAELRFSPPNREGNARAWMRVLIVQPHGIPYLVHQDCGTDAGSHIAARARCSLLRRGDTVTVYAEGLAVSPMPTHLQVMGISSVQPVVTPPRQTP